MKPTPQAIENAAREMCRSAWQGSKIVDGDALADSGEYDLFYRDLAQAALSVDLGDMVLVPKAATGAMCEAARSFDEAAGGKSYEYRDLYRAMIAAAEGER